jgi:hypothetical protein
MMRSIWAVVAGFLFIMMLSIGTVTITRAMSPRLFDANGGTTNFAILCVWTICVGVFAVVGCYLAARLAPSHPMRHALILGALGLILHLVTLVAMPSVWNMTPNWYSIVNLVLVMPYAWLGGRLRENEIRGSSPTTSNPATA